MALDIFGVGSDERCSLSPGALLHLRLSFIHMDAHVLAASWALHGKGMEDHWNTTVTLAFWSPKRIWRRALRLTFIRHRNMRCSPSRLGTVVVAVLVLANRWPGCGGMFRLSSAWTAAWSCLSMISYTESPWMSRSSCGFQTAKRHHSDYLSRDNNSWVGEVVVVVMLNIRTSQLNQTWVLSPSYLAKPSYLYHHISGII